MQKILIQHLVFTVFFFFIFINQAFAVDTKTTKATMAAEEFLLLVDTSQYGQSWDAASSFFKSQVPKETWVKQISSVRTAFGKVTNRQILKAQYMTQLPGAPDGQYVILQYDTTFENKRKAVETITPMLDKDGKWLVSGYFIQ